jgi:hypothetical protein
VKANELLSLDPESARSVLGEDACLFHSLADPVYQNSGANKEDCERMVWVMAIEREKFRHATPEQTTDKADFSLVRNVEPYHAWQLLLEASKSDVFSKNLMISILGLMVLLMAFIQYFRMRERQQSSSGHSAEFQRFVESFLNDQDPESAVMEISLLSVHHGLHPLVLSLSGNDAWHSLTESEKLVAALVYDEIPTQQIIRETRKNAGTIYNLRSTIRRKLALAEAEDLRQGLKQLVKANTRRGPVHRSFQ